ncbi:mitochondrial amidoxime-reducing component 1 [Gadus chalcogrammus]|uniref:mitochondrial amidoxime-reducing component 1 n=1 Tax=Gadus chalcogrammus TaxID=1042646 RepID=UPI0024C269F8|nr:mitochondrial amidoxime-reducing component 1 [Gadus chalcogrammus]
MDFEKLSIAAIMQNKKLYLVIGGAGAAVVCLGLAWRSLRSREKVRVGVVSQLLVHPLKSGKGISVALAECHHIGLKHGELRDRHWLVVKEDGHMVTGRQQPRLVLVALTSDGGRLCLNGPGMEELQMPLQQPHNPIMDCRVFGTDIQGRDCGDEAARWLTRFLEGEIGYRLVHFEPHMEPRKSADQEKLFSQDEKVAYPDVGPVMLLSEASVGDLNGKLQKDVTVERFRPNIVVSDCNAFEEDSWTELLIGDVRLHRVMSCGRCIFTTVDPETGIISRKEPLDTLKGYRQCQPSEAEIYKKSPLFGQFFTVKKTGIIQVGDVVYRIGR